MPRLHVGFFSEFQRFINGSVRSDQVTADVDRGDALLRGDGVEGGGEVFRWQLGGEIVADAKQVVQGVLVFDSCQASRRGAAVLLFFGEAGAAKVLVERSQCNVF